MSVCQHVTCVNVVQPVNVSQPEAVQRLQCLQLPHVDVTHSIQPDAVGRRNLPHLLSSHSIIGDSLQGGLITLD